MEDAGSEREDNVEESAPNVIVSRMAFSADGQWLATTDDHCRTHIYNLDAVQVSICLPKNCADKRCQLILILLL